MINPFSARSGLPVDIFPDLTRGERKVLTLMVQGISNETIVIQRQNRVELRVQHFLASCGWPTGYRPSQGERNQN